MPAATNALRPQGQQSAPPPPNGANGSQGQPRPAERIDQIITRGQAQFMALFENDEGKFLRFKRLVVTAIMRDEKLLKCTPASIINCALNAAQLRLEPSDVRGECFFIARWNKDLQQFEATFQVGVQGYVELGLRSPKVKRIECEIVRFADHFDFDRAAGTISHKWALGDNRGQTLGFWALVEYVTEGVKFVVMSMGEVEEVRERFGNASSPAWRNNFEAMGLKTVLRRLSRFLPREAQIAEKLEQIADYGGTARLRDGGQIEEIAAPDYAAQLPPPALQDPSPLQMATAQAHGRVQDQEPDYAPAEVDGYFSTGPQQAREEPAPCQPRQQAQTPSQHTSQPSGNGGYPWVYTSHDGFDQSAHVGTAGAWLQRFMRAVDEICQGYGSEDEAIEAVKDLWEANAEAVERLKSQAPQTHAAATKTFENTVAQA